MAGNRETNAQESDWNTLNPPLDSLESAIDDQDFANDEEVQQNRALALSRIRERIIPATATPIGFDWNPEFALLRVSDVEACVALENAAFFDEQHRQNPEKVSIQIPSLTSTQRASSPCACAYMWQQIMYSSGTVSKETFLRSIWTDKATVAERLADRLGRIYLYIQGNNAYTILARVPKVNESTISWVKLYDIGYRHT